MSHLTKTVEWRRVTKVRFDQFTEKDGLSYLEREKITYISIWKKGKKKSNKNQGFVDVNARIRWKRKISTLRFR